MDSLIALTRAASALQGMMNTPGTTAGNGDELRGELCVCTCSHLNAVTVGGFLISKQCMESSSA